VQSKGVQQLTIKQEYDEMISKPLNNIALLLFLTCCFMLTLLAQEKFPSRDSKVLILNGYSPMGMNISKINVITSYIA